MPDSQHVESSPEVIAEARQLGWVPQEEFRGDQSRWVDADSFVKRGHEVMPILKANNARLMGEVTSLKATLTEATQAIAQLRETSEEITRERVAAAKASVISQLKQAKEAGDVDAEMALTDQLTDIRAAEKVDKAKPAAPEAPAIDPAFTSWAARPENSWFGSDRRRTSLAMGIAQELRGDPANAGLVGTAFYEKVAREVEVTLGDRKPAADKVEGARNSGSSGSGTGAGGKGYSGLPPEAKAACDKQGAKFIGKPGFKTESDWRSYYAKLYFAGE